MFPCIASSRPIREDVTDESSRPRSLRAPEVLRVDEIERPVPMEDEVLVKVHASTVTRGDAMGVRHREYLFARLFTGIRRPRKTTAGSEFAGRVEEVGER